MKRVQHPGISVIITVFNGAKYIAEFMMPTMESTTEINPQIM